MKNYLFKMSITTCIILLSTIFTFPSTMAYSQEQRIRIRIDGHFLDIPYYEQQPTIIDGRTLVPLRVVMEALYVGVHWNESDQSVRFSIPDTISYIQIGSHYMNIEFHDEPIYLDVPPLIINDRTMVDISVIRHATRFAVDWDAENFNINITRSYMPIVIQRPIVRPYYWPEHLPYHVPGSIDLHSEHAFEGLVAEHQFPMQFRAVFYRMTSDFMDLVPSEQITAKDRYVWGDPSVIAGETMALMRFIQVHNISREDFDDVIEQILARRAVSDAILNINPYDEWEELPNADIIFTFDNDIIRYFYRRQ